MFKIENNRGQAQQIVSIVVGLILLVILVLGVAYKFVKDNASATALNISASAPEYSLITYFPLFIVLIAFLGVVGFLVMRAK